MLSRRTLLKAIPAAILLPKCLKAQEPTKEVGTLICNAYYQGTQYVGSCVTLTENPDLQRTIVKRFLEYAPKIDDVRFKEIRPNQPEQSFRWKITHLTTKPMWILQKWYPPAKWWYTIALYYEDLTPIRGLL